MLLRLSRLSFWLAAGVAALTLLAPGGHETALTGLAVVGSVLALGLWRAALHGEARRPAAAFVAAPAAVLDPDSAPAAAALMLQRALVAASFEAALHAVAQVLRGELGARGASVHEVLSVDATHAQLSDLIESQPGFRTVARRIRLDGAPLAQALRSGRETGTPPGALALPVACEGRVVAVIVLSGVDLPVDPAALADLLALARATLSQRADAGPDGLNARRETQSGAEERLREPGFDDHLFTPFRQSRMLAMLSKPSHVPVSAESAAASSVGPIDAADGDVLDAAAIARLTELDPTGQSRLLERVLQAFRASVARLRPQLDAARGSGDRAAVRLVVHTLKSSSASIGARRLSQLCGEIETSIRVDADAALEAPLDALDDALDGALRAIDSLLKDRA